MKKIKGTIKPEYNTFDFDQTQFFAKNIIEIDEFKKKVAHAISEKINEVDSKINEVNATVESAETTVQKVVEKAKMDLVDHTNSIIEQVQGLEMLQGEPGKPADEDKIVEKVLERIPKPEKAPKLDEKALFKKFLAQLPENKADLKIIQKNFEVDPMSVIDKIMELPEGKFKLKPKNIDGLEQTISAMRNQLSRGYLHGGGISEVIHDDTLTGKGTTASPLRLSATALIGNHDISSQFDGVTTTFTIPEYSSILLFNLAGWTPSTLRPTVDFTTPTSTTVALTSEVSAPVAGTTGIILYIPA
jgi:hypothetical protein